MPRLREVPRAEVTDERIIKYYDHLFGPDRDPVAEPGTATGTPGDWWTVFALSPNVFRHATNGFILYRKSTVDPVIRELGQTRAGFARGSQFVYSQHCKQLRNLGLSEEKIAAIPSWSTSSLFDDRERVVLAYTDALVLEGGRVPDELFARLRDHFTDEVILEFTYVTCMYEMHATMSRALRLEYDDRDEPVTEVAAPAGFGNRDMAADLAGS
jgi:alkylhydroperoxidase family enzyme